MKKYYIIAATLLALVACSKEVAENQENQEEVNIAYFTARLDESLTKATYGDPYQDQYGKKIPFKWQEGDIVGVYVHKQAMKGEEHDTSLRKGVVTSITDGVATIGYDFGIGDNKTVDIINVWYPYKEGQTNDLDAIPTTQLYHQDAFDSKIGTTVTHFDPIDGLVSIPLRATSKSITAYNTAGVSSDASTLEFEPYIDYAVIGYRFTKGNANRTIKSITVGSYSLTDINVALEEGKTRVFYVVLPANAYSDKPVTASIVANDGSTDLTYTRKKSSFTTESRKVKVMPVISDLDNTGKHMWYFGTGQTNSGEAPFQYWYNTSSTSFTNVVSNSGTVSETNYTYVTVTTTTSDNLKFSGNSGITVQKDKKAQTSTDGLTISKRDETLTVHAGNYPVFAIMMNSPWKYGNSGTPKFDTDNDAQTTYRGELKDRTFLAGYENDLPKPSIFYYILDDNAFNGNASNYNQAVKMITWQLKFDRTYSSAHDKPVKYNVYWAGFFNSVAELTTFASTHFIYQDTDLPAENY